MLNFCKTLFMGKLWPQILPPSSIATTHSYVQEKDLFPTLVSPPDLIATPTGHVPQVLGIPCPSVLGSWPVETLPLQRRWYAHVVDHLFTSLSATLRQSGDDHVARLESLVETAWPSHQSR